MKLTRTERNNIARKRLLNVLRTHGIATMRTLEQKISDAGPSPQRIDPHVLSRMRGNLVKDGIISEYKISPKATTWYHLTMIPFESVSGRFKEQNDVYKQ